ncbi:unnamed protein product, partial [Prorocentrum cordatum]
AAPAESAAPRVEPAQPKEGDAAWASASAAAFPPTRPPATPQSQPVPPQPAAEEPATDKHILMKRVNAQIHRVMETAKDLAGCEPEKFVLEDATQKAEQSISQLCHSDLVKKLNALHAADAKLLDDAKGKGAQEEDDFWGAMKKVDFNFGTACTSGNGIAGRWARALKADGDLAKEYRSRQGCLQKAEFRAAWAKGKYDKHQMARGRSKEEKHVKAEVKNGTYVSLGRLAWLEGGGASGVRIAVRYVLKYLHVQHSLRDEFKRCWRAWEEWASEPGADEA